MKLQDWRTLGFNQLAQHRRRYEEQLQRRRDLRQQRKQRASMDQRLDQAEDDLAAMLLLVMAVRQELLNSKLLAEPDLIDELRRIDLLDDVADGKLDPAAIRPAAKSESPEEFLRGLQEEE